MQNQTQPNAPEENIGDQKKEQVTPITPEVTQSSETKLEQSVSVEPSLEIPTGVNPTPPQQIQQQQPVQPIQDPASDDQVISDAADDKKEKGMEKLDKTWVDSANKIINDYEDKPFEEEEKSEDLQIDYLDKRFGKKLEKSKDE